jgi:hypothetical protein
MNLVFRDEEEFASLRNTYRKAITFPSNAVLRMSPMPKKE